MRVRGSHKACTRVVAASSGGAQSPAARVHGRCQSRAARRQEGMRPALQPCRQGAGQRRAADSQRLPRHTVQPLARGVSSASAATPPSRRSSALATRSAHRRGPTCAPSSPMLLPLRSREVSAEFFASASSSCAQQHAPLAFPSMLPVPPQPRRGFFAESWAAACVRACASLHKPTGLPEWGRYTALPLTCALLHSHNGSVHAPVACSDACAASAKLCMPAVCM